MVPSASWTIMVCSQQRDFAISRRQQMITSKLVVTYEGW